MSPLFEVATPHPAGHRDVTPAQVAAHREGVRIIDVREPHELTGELGNIIEAELVPLCTIARAARTWSKAADYVLVCRSGRRSEQATRTLTAVGFTHVMNMVGGMLAWNEARLPVERAVQRK
jgi:rhodanese-related sulfurtransferase